MEWSSEPKKRYSGTVATPKKDDKEGEKKEEEIGVGSRKNVGGSWRLVGGPREAAQVLI